MTDSPTVFANQATLEADLQRLDAGLRQLKVQYDMFFIGALNREPIETRAEIDRIVKRYANAPIQKYAQRFLLSTLVSRYNSLAELWGKTLRAREVGQRPIAVAADAAKPVEELVASERFAGTTVDGTQLRRIYDRFVAARLESGENRAAPPFERFVSGIEAQTSRLRESSGCGEIELRVVVSDRKVMLKAKPGR